MSHKVYGQGKNGRNQRSYARKEEIKERCFYSTGTGSSFGSEKKSQGKRKKFKRSDTSVLTSSHAHGRISRGEGASIKHST